MMSVEDKSLELAKLMEWNIPAGKKLKTLPKSSGSALRYYPLDPYRSDTEYGLAQSMAILLKYPEVMGRVVTYDVGDMHESAATIITADNAADELPPTQANLMDEVLRMNGVNIDE